MKLYLTVQNKQEELVLKYLQDNASETLADKINNGTPFEKDGKPLTNKKTLVGFMKYACDEARKLTEKGANSACIDDATVYGWAIHYFEEESIEGTLYTIDGAEYKPPPVKRVESNAVKANIQPPKQQNIQFSLFDKFDENGVKDSTDDTLSDESDTNNENVSDSEQPTETVTEHIKEQPKGNQTYRDYMLYQSERPTAIVALRLGDFYEVFGDNAVVLGNELELTITSRDVGLESRVPMIGFPYHAAENYFAKIAKRHDLYIIETPYDTQFIPCVNCVDNRLIDEDTGEILCEDLTEDDMRKFDGDIEEPEEIYELEQTAVDNEIINKLKAVFDNTLIMR
jgi:hypothetical protein